MVQKLHLICHFHPMYEHPPLVTARGQAVIHLILVAEKELTPIVESRCAVNARHPPELLDGRTLEFKEGQAIGLGKAEEPLPWNIEELLTQGVGLKQPGGCSFTTAP